MKKLFAILIAMIMMFSTVGCDLLNNIKTPEEELEVTATPSAKVTQTPISTPKATATSKPTATPNEEPQNQTMNLTIESCRFAEKIRPMDVEYAANELYSMTVGNIFVDVVLKITDNGAKVTKDTFSGNLEFDDARYDLKFCTEWDSSQGVDQNGVIEANAGGRVHLYAIVPERANGADITVNFKAWGKEYSCKVQPMETVTDHFSVKTQLKKGDKISVNDLEIEVVDCQYTKVVRARDYDNSKQIGWTYPVVDCVLKITNNGKNVVNTLNSYMVIDGEVLRARECYETNNNTDINQFNMIIGVGQTTYVHLIGGKTAQEVEEGQRVMRFNYGGNCYYCYAE